MALLFLNISPFMYLLVYVKYKCVLNVTLFCSSASLDHSAGLPVTCIPQTADSGYCLVPSDPSQSYCVMSTGSAPQQGPVYWMPAMVAVPYGANVGQVNMGWTPTYNRDIAPAGGQLFQLLVSDVFFL